MKNLSIDVHGHDHEADQRLYDLLTKEGSNSPEDNEEEMAGEAPDLYDGPGDRAQGDIDAPWGEETSSKKDNEAVHFSDSFFDSFKKSREEMLSRLFTNKSSSDSTNEKIISQRFTEKSDDLPVKTSSAQETLVERVRRLTGRH